MAEAEKILDQVVQEFRPTLLESSGHTAHKIKGNNTPVTELDLAIEKRLRELLASLDASIGFVGEEHGSEGSDETFWFIDPIDGTEQFVRGIPAFRTMATLINDGAPVYAYVYDIPKGERYTARRGQGAFCNGSQLQVSDRPLSRCWTEFTCDLTLPEVGALLAPLRKSTRGTRITGDFTHTPQGRFDAHFFYHGTGGLWDWVPWALIIQEAGGRVENLFSTKYDYRNRDFLAANPIVFDELKAIIETTLAAVK